MRNINSILEQLKSENYNINDTSEHNNEIKSNPWFVNVLIGISAWLASLFGFAFIIFKLWNIESKFSMVFIGLISLSASLWIIRESKHIFLKQFSLALCILGQLTLVYGSYSIFDDGVMTSLVNIFLQALVIILFKNTIIRFLSVPAIVISILFIIGESDTLFLYHILIFILSVALLYLFIEKDKIIFSNFSGIWSPIAYGVAISFLALFIILLNSEFEIMSKITPWISTTFVAISLIISIILILKKHAISIKNTYGIVMISFVIILSAFTINSPGILAALFVMILAFNYRNTYLFGVSQLFLVAYTISYYYFMDITLLYKSLILISVGVLMLFSRYLLNKLVGDKK